MPDRTRIFIGSSTENLALARAIQENLDQDLETKIWDQDVFRLSRYALEALLGQLSSSDFGVFVLAPDDIARIRGKRQIVARDNVIFELGLFIGRLGRDRTFIVVPRGATDLHFPTDLLGITLGDYDPDRSDMNLTAAMGQVCNKIRKLVSAVSVTASDSPGILRCDVFTAFSEDFRSLIRNSDHITLYFIHSRRWRENHNDDIRYALSKPQTRLTVFLPNLWNNALMASLVSHFSDGPYIHGFIADAYDYFSDLRATYGRKVKIFLFEAYPTYSFYRFDDKTIVAMYPTTPAKKSVPTFLVAPPGLFETFLSKDLKALARSSKKPIAPVQLKTLLARKIRR